MTTNYLALIPAGRPSLAALFLAVEETRVTFLAFPDEDYDNEMLSAYGNQIRTRYIAAEEMWYHRSNERAGMHGFHALAFSSVRVPVEPTEAEAYLAAPHYSERIRRD